MKDLTNTMSRVRETTYGMFPQTYTLSVIHLKSNKKIIEGAVRVQLMTGHRKEINVRFDLKKDELIIKEKKVAKEEGGEEK